MKYNYSYDVFLNGELLPDVFSKEEEKFYFERLNENDENARKEIIEHNIRLVISIARSFRNYPYETEELVSVGTIGLMKSIDKFDENKGTFATFARRCIENEILMFMRHELPNSKVASFNDKVTSKVQEEFTLKDVICDENASFVSKYEEQDTYRVVRKVVSELSDRRAKQLVIKYFGFENDVTLTQKELSANFGVCQGLISRELKSELENIREKLEEEGIVGMPSHFYEQKKSKVLKKK